MPSCCPMPVAILWDEGRQTDARGRPAHLDVVIAALMAEPVSPADVSMRAPTVAGLYAWWARPAVLSTLAGSVHPRTRDLRLLYVGLATPLRSRLASNHLRRSGSSTLHRTLAGLLLGDEHLQ